MKNQKQNKLKPSKVMKFLFLFLSLAFLAFGCSSFQSTQRLDLSPFANSMITVAGDIQYSLFQHRLVSVRKAAEGPEVEKFAANVNKLRRIIRGIIAYSIEIVTVSESNKSGSEKAITLADYLEGLKRPVLEEPIPELHLTVEQLDTIIMNVRSKEKFLDALAAAQPLIDEVARATGELTEDSKTQLDMAYLEINKEWENEYSGAIWATNLIKSRQLGTLNALYYGGEYLRGNPNGLDSLFVYDPLSKELFPEGHKLTRGDLLKIESRLYNKLGLVQDLKDIFQQDMIDYEEGLLELDEVKQAYNDALRKARTAVLMWTRAHLQLSRGVTEPAEIDIMQLMMGTAKRFIPGL
jgi:hypothetical protein